MSRFYILEVILHFLVLKNNIPIRSWSFIRSWSHIRMTIESWTTFEGFHETFLHVAICLKLVFCPSLLPPFGRLQAFLITPSDFIWPSRVRSFLNDTSVYLVFILSWAYLQGELLSIGYWIACSSWVTRLQRRNQLLCRYLHNIKHHMDFIFHVSLLISRPPFIAHPASQTDISGWIFKVDINFLPGIFLSLDVSYC